MMQFSSVHPNARIAANVEIGPYCYIAENVEIGEGCVIGPHVTIFDYVKIGKNCKIFPGAVIGAIPQDMKYSGEVTWVEIGNNTVIRECATVNRGTAASGKMLTKIGDNCLIMSYAHVAHDCRIGNHVIQVSYVGLAGETDVDDWAITAVFLRTQQCGTAPKGIHQRADRPYPRDIPYHLQQWTQPQ